MEIRAKKNIGILGGSFDPPTIAHIQIAAEIYNNTEINELWIIPCGDGREDKSLRTKGFHRLNMLKLILKDIIDESVPIKIDDIEIRNNKYYPTTVLLEELQTLYPDDKFYFCLGADLVESLGKWEGGPYLLENQEFIILKRPQFDPPKSAFPKHYILLPLTIDCSSTQVRNRILEEIKFVKKKRLGISGLTTNSVIKYIQEQDLYNNGSNTKLIVSKFSG